MKAAIHGEFTDGIPGKITRRVWAGPGSDDVPEAILAACGGDEHLAQIVCRRGFRDPVQIESFLDPDAYTPAPPQVLPDLVLAAAMLSEAIRAGTRILIWGDFDVDGQTATALLLDGLRGLGADCAYYIPDRNIESHGIKPESLAARLDELQPGLLLTCDTGVTEHEAIAFAKTHGLPVVVTDHHNLGATLPPADAVVNPKRLPDGHPLITLPGVGVAYKLMQHLYTVFGREAETDHLLDLVALGIVADVAAQVNDTRYLLQIGLNSLRHTGRIGLQALMKVAGVAPEGLTAEQIGFQLSPRLNAIGRLANAMLAVELLTVTDEVRAVEIAQHTEALNNERKLLSRQVEESAEALIEKDRTLLNSLALVLYAPNWPKGILGITANRLAERYFRPVILLSGEGEIVSGSARTGGGYDIGSAIAAQDDLLIRFGGHFGAAGLTLAADKIGVLRERLSRTLATMGATAEVPPLPIDLVLPLETITEKLVYSLEKLSPCGEGNPPPVIACTGLHLSHAGVVGRESRHLKLAVEDDAGHVLHLMWWDGAGKGEPHGTFDAAFRVAIDRHGEVEATLVDVREIGEAEPVEAKPTRTIHDWRRERDPYRQLEAVLREAPDTQVWAEAYPRTQHPGFRRRAELTLCTALAIYGAPPDPATLAEALARTNAQIVHVFGVEPPLDDLQNFLRQVKTAAQDALRRFSGDVALEVLCGAVAGSPGAVRAALEYLAADGHIGLRWNADLSHALIGDPSAPPADRAALRPLLDRLKLAYDESAAYRRHFRVMPLERLADQG